MKSIIIQNQLKKKILLLLLNLFHYYGLEEYMWNREGRDSEIID